MVKGLEIMSRGKWLRKNGTNSGGSPCSYPRLSPICILDPILARLLKDFDAAIIPVLISLVSHYL